MYRRDFILYTKIRSIRLAIIYITYNASLYVVVTIVITFRRDCYLGLKAENKQQNYLKKWFKLLEVDKFFFRIL
jgi:hypothetical protein